MDQDQRAADQARAQTAIHEAIQANPALPGALLVGWTIVAEWATPEDERKLARLTSKDATNWQVTGYLHQALFAEEPWSDGIAG